MPNLQRLPIFINHQLSQMLFLEQIELIFPKLYFNDQDCIQLVSGLKDLKNLTLVDIDFSENFIGLPFMQCLYSILKGRKLRELSVNFSQTQMDQKCYSMLLELIGSLDGDSLLKLQIHVMNYSYPFRVDNKMFHQALKSKWKLEELVLNFAYQKLNRQSIINLTSGIIQLEGLQVLHLNLYSTQ